MLRMDFNFLTIILNEFIANCELYFRYEYKIIFAIEVNQDYFFCKKK